MVTKYSIKNLDCANCALKIERHLEKHPAVKEVSLNFSTLKLHIDTDDIDLVRREIKKIEPEVEIVVPKRIADAESESFSVKKELFTIAISLTLFVIHLLFERQLKNTPFGLGEYAVALPAYLLAGWHVLAGAFFTIKKGKLFDENVLMTLATLGAFAIHAVSESVGVMIFFKIGEFLQNLAVDKSRRSIRALLEIRPDYANLKTDSGTKKVHPEEVTPGEVIVVKAGEKIPLDGVVIEGTSYVNTSALTGESTPAEVKPGDQVRAGEINCNNVVVIRVTRVFADSSLAKILDLVENATARKAQTEQFISRFAHYYTPVIVFCALAVALIPPLFIPDQTFATWIYRSLVLLVVSCPCALVISIPLGYFGGIGGASRKGILVKGSNVIDALADIKSIIFDKTGTLTRGCFVVKEVVPANGFTCNELLSLAATAEQYSNHPIAQSICEAASRSAVDVDHDIAEHQEIAGYGVMAKNRGRTIIVGKDALMHRENIKHSICAIAGTVIHVSTDGTYAGYIIIGDEIKDDALKTIANLRKAGVTTITMLTGDNKDAAEFVAKKLGLDSFYAELLPEEKVAQFEILKSECHSGKVAFVGDGINDSPVLARADVGIAMGSRGSDAAIETADVVLMTDHLCSIAEAISISKKTRTIVWQNIIFALTIKLIFISFGAFGLAGMWEAVFADMGTALIAVLNSTRSLRA